MADLITLDEYKTYKGKAKTDDDDKIVFLISSVSALIKAYVGHSIIDNWDEPVTDVIHTPYDSTNIYLDAYPIRQIISVDEVSGGYVGGLDSTIKYPMQYTADYLFSQSGGVLNRIGKTWARTIEVTYTSGYQTVPEQIKLAAIEMVSYYLNEEWKPARTMQGTSIAGPTAEAGGIPKHVAPMLDHYKVGR